MSKISLNRAVFAGICVVWAFMAAGCGPKERPTQEPNAKNAQIEQGEEALETSRWTEAAASFSEALKSDPKNETALFGRSGAYLALGRAYYKKAVESAELGEIAQAQDETAKADEAFGKAFDDCQAILAQNAEQPDAHYAIGCIRLYQGDWDGAIESFSTVIRIQPENPYPYQRRGEVFGHIGDTVNETMDLKKAAELGYRDQPEPENAAPSEPSGTSDGTSSDVSSGEKSLETAEEF